MHSGGEADTRNAFTVRHVDASLSLSLSRFLRGVELSREDTTGRTREVGHR
jgi:hypothetical protein